MSKSGNDFLSEEEVKSGNGFRSELRKIRASMGLTQREAADAIRVSSRTVRLWESGTVIPSAVTREAALLRLRNCRKAPSQRKRDSLKDSHHLYWEEHRGWTLRFTLELNKKLVGKRMKIRLRTHCLQEAIERRELLIQQYQKLGFKVSDRRQKRSKSNHEEQRPHE